MNRHVSSIAGRLSLRPPQVRSLEILDRICDLAPPKKGADVVAARAVIQRAFPGIKGFDFERDFPSVCFALATGVGKTRLMGAFVSYLYLAHGVRNFFVLAPNLTIYNKLIADFTPNTPKYVFRGVEGFAINPPHVITGDNYTSRASSIFDQADDCKINIFNISKINTEVRGGKMPRIKRLSEYLGQSYFDYLAALPDLVLLMDESHRYRASAGARAISELKPVLGLELTATPFVETTKAPVPFKNVVFDYALAKAMADGFVKEPAVVTRKDFRPADMKPEEVERVKLEDGVRLHEQVKVELETYARQTNQKVVKPFVLVIARDTTHAAQLLATIQSDQFFDGRYTDRVIQVDSSKTGKEEDEMIQRLLAVESTDEPTEIVIHVNMLKEGWDVTNLYTIIPLRAANARTLIEQSIGRGLRLPYGKRSGLFREVDGKKLAHPVDRLNIVAHDKFQEIVEDARKLDSPLKLEYLILDPAELERPTRSVVSKSRLDEMLDAEPPAATEDGAAPASQPPADGLPAVPPLYATAGERQAARAAVEVIRSFQTLPDEVPTLDALRTPAMQERIVAATRQRLGSIQQTLPGMELDLANVVAKMTDEVVGQTIQIPKINVMPKGEVRCGYHPFKVDTSSFRLAVPTQDLHVQNLRTGDREVIAVGGGGIEERRLEDYIVVELMGIDDISYDDHADLLYDLAGQTVEHFRAVMKYEDDDTRKVLRQNQRLIGAAIHEQMMRHYWQESAGYEAVITRGFTDLKESAYTAAKEPARDFRDPPADKGKIGQFIYAGFQRCLFRQVKFQSDTERKMAVILDRDSSRWFRPAKGQFQIYYKISHEEQWYQPDFVAETEAVIYMVETKAASSMSDAEVVAKRNAGATWCRHASEHAAKHGGKPWRYLLIPHDAVDENMTMAGLAGRYGVKD